MGRFVYPFTYEQLSYKTDKKRKHSGGFSRHGTFRLLAFILVITVSFIAGMLADSIFSGSTEAKADEIHSSPSFVEVGAGDTLWSIAAAYCPEKMDIREYVDLLKEANRLQGSLIVPGQKLVLPLL